MEVKSHRRSRYTVTPQGGSGSGGGGGGCSGTRTNTATAAASPVPGEYAVDQIQPTPLRMACQKMLKYISRSTLVFHQLASSLSVARAPLAIPPPPLHARAPPLSSGSSTSYFRTCCNKGCTQKSDVASSYGSCGTTLKYCALCMSVCYCSKACQTTDWHAGHKTMCKKADNRKVKKRNQSTDEWFLSVPGRAVARLIINWVDSYVSFSLHKRRK